MKVRFSDDLRERNTGSIQIDIRIAIDIRQTFVHVLARVFFQMQTRNPDLLRTPLERMTGFVTLSGQDLEFTVGRKGLIVLRNLITLRQVRIKVILAREDRLVVDV